MSVAEDSSDQNVNRASWFTRAMLWAGVACCLQFLVVGGVGVVRGYSVQSWIPVWILVIGVFLLLPSFLKHKLASILVPGMLILLAIVSRSQGEHREQGEALQEEGKYEEAIVEFHKEIDTWHHRLHFNRHEAASMFGIANSHSQLERFEKARETYLEMARICRDYYQGRAKEELVAIDANLAKVRDAEKLLAEAADDAERATLRFDLALVYRGLHCSRKAIEQYEAIQALDVRDTRKEQARRFAEKLR